MREATYTTRDGDVLDLICLQRYGTTAGGVVERVLAANPGLADYGPILPQGVVILLPDIAATTARTKVRLWG